MPNAPNDDDDDDDDDGPNGRSRWSILKIINGLPPKNITLKMMSIINPFPPMSANWHLWILLCLTPDDFTRQRGTPWEVKG